MDVPPIDLTVEWTEAIAFDAFTREGVEHQRLWKGVCRLVRLPEWMLDHITRNDRHHVLAVAGGWPGTASDIIPVWTTRVTPLMRLPPP